MRSLKTYLFLLLGIILMVSFNACDFGSLFGPSDNVKFAYSVEIIYERVNSSYDYYDISGVTFDIVPVEPTDEWHEIRNVSTEKISENKCKYLAEKLPANVEIFVCAHEEDTVGKKFIINGIELTDIREYPNGPGTAAFFKIKPDGTVIP